MTINKPLVLIISLLLMVGSALLFGSQIWSQSEAVLPETTRVAATDSTDATAVKPSTQPAAQVTVSETEADASPIASSTEAVGASDGAADLPDGEPNRLINEKSPYLLQHAYNPVDWYPWGEEAFEAARAENKPIFLSIGYSTCHWCHVMRDESFEDAEVAALMNENFIAIKVDREERPDIDNIYMDVAMLMNGSGGWPLNVVLTPDQVPFFSGTYIPKESRFGRGGLLDLLPQLVEVWTTQQADIADVGHQILDILSQDVAESAVGEVELDEALLQTTLQELSGRFDPQDGGFGSSPKFPTPHNMLFLLRYWKRTGNPGALQMVETTLQAMRRGGIYDQMGHGFHRYSTDSTWLVPHFEKMLYDQALLSLVYTEAYQVTGKPEYEQVARETLAYVLRDMTEERGGFFSAEDADSEGEEGKFYLWTVAEIKQVLGEPDAELFMDVFNVMEAGNFVEPIAGKPVGTNILHQSKPLADLAEAYQLSEAEIKAKIESLREQLFEAREMRIHPHKDDKILTDWNGLMIAAFAKAGQLFDEPEYIEAATQAADFILDTLRQEDGRLLHRYRDGEAGLQANLDDYAFFNWGLLELYEATFDLRYLETAIELNETMLTLFADEELGGFFLTPTDGEPLLVRQKEIYDGAIPSGNSVAMLNLLRLGRLTANPAYEAQAARIGEAFARDVSQAPSAHTQFMVGVDFGVGPSYEVVIVGEAEEADTQLMLAALHETFIPKKVMLFISPETKEKVSALAEYTEYHFMLNDKATAYVCLNYQCELPTNEVEQMLRLLGQTE